MNSLKYLLVMFLLSSVASAWLGSYSYRREINCSDSQVLGVPIIINGSKGFDIGGTGQDVWVNCSEATMYLYYDSETSYAVADSGDNAVAFDVEFGNVTSANYTDVWGSITTYHLYDGNDSTDTYNLTYNGDGLSHEGGVFYNAAAFAGTDDYFSNSFTVVPTYYSIEAWVKVTDNDLFEVISHMRDTSNGEAKFRIENNEDLQFDSRDAGGAQACTATGGMTGYYGSYAYLVATWDGTNARIFRNGTLIQTCAWNAITGNAGAAAHTYGVEADGSSWDYVGSIDELREWDINVTAEQVNASFQNRLGAAGFGNLEAEEVYLYSSLTETYNSSGTELKTTSFILEVDELIVGDMGANFTWNGTVYEDPGKAQTGDNFTFTKTITLPEVDNDSTVSFNWDYEINNSSYSLSSHDFVIYNVNFTNCTGGDTSTEFITFFLLDENTNTSLYNGTAQVELNISYGHFYFNYGDIDHNFSICGYPPGETFTVDSLDIFGYTTSGYGSRDYFMRDVTLSNVTEEIDLYLLNSSTSDLANVTFTVENRNQEPLSGHILRIRKYMGNNNYPVVAECLTHTDGTCLEEIELNKYYKFTVLDGSTVLTLSCADCPVEIAGTSVTIIVDEGGYGEYWDLCTEDIMFNCTTNRTANFTRCEWADTTGTFTEACLEVIYRAWNVTTSAYSGCDSSASSSLSYTYTDPSLFYDWQFTITHTVAGVTFELCGDSGTYSGNVTPDYEDWSLFLVFMVVITFAMLGATQGASMSLLGGGIGFALCAVAGLVAVSIEWVIGIFLALVVGAYLVSR